MVSCGRLSVREKSMWWDLARAVEQHTVKTKSGAPGLQYSQIALLLHALGKANVKIKDRREAKREEKEEKRHIQKEALKM